MGGWVVAAVWRGWGRHMLLQAAAFGCVLVSEELQQQG
jgi:hypothetical protein